MENEKTFDELNNGDQAIAIENWREILIEVYQEGSPQELTEVELKEYEETLTDEKVIESIKNEGMPMDELL